MLHAPAHTYGQVMYAELNPDSELRNFTLSKGPSLRHCLAGRMGKYRLSFFLSSCGHAGAQVAGIQRRSCNDAPPFPSCCGLALVGRLLWKATLRISPSLHVAGWLRMDATLFHQPCVSYDYI